MQPAQIVKRVAGVLLTLLLFSFPLSAQHRKPGSTPIKATSKQQEPPPTFESLLAADSYKIYIEVRGIGQLVDSAGVNDFLDPVLKFTSPPKEFRTIVKWLHYHAPDLLGARMMFAAWPAVPKLPQFISAVEFPSAEDAERFEPQLREILTKVIPASEPKPSASRESGKRTHGPPAAQANLSQPALPSYSVRQTGALLLIGPAGFSISNLRSKGGKLLTEDENFRLAHDRLASEPLFVYFNVALEDQNAPHGSLTPEPRVVMGTAQTNGQSGEVSVNDSYVVAKPTPETPHVIVAPPEESQPAAQSAEPATDETGAYATAANSPGPDPIQAVMSAFFPFIYGGPPSWPEAAAGALAFESESYNLRLLLINNEHHKRSPIPFIPQLISGPPLSPAAPSIFPSDTELLVTVSLDYGQIYERWLKALAHELDPVIRFKGGAAKDRQPETPFVALEKKLGVKLKEEVLPLLGNELAVSLPVKLLDLGPPKTTAPLGESTDNNDLEKPKLPHQTAPVIAISLINKEATRALVPRIIESSGFKGATLLAQTEKREGTELVSYGDSFSYLFVEDFLLVSSDVKALRHIVDSYSSHETLAANSHFRNSTQWQPRQLLGQIYVSQNLMESYNSFAQQVSSEKMQELLSRLSQVGEPVTYALSNEGSTMLHELHLPRSLVMLATASIFGEVSASRTLANEAFAQSVLRTIASAEETYKATSGDGRFGALDELVSQGLLSRESWEKSGYKVEVNVYASGFEASAVPAEYGKTGRLSFFIDQSLVLRAGDHGGGSATVADSPVR